MKGLLITLEGIDGSGKSTVAHVLERKLTEAMPDRRFVFTAEPTKGEAGQILRAHLSASAYECENALRARRIEELLLFMADHADHLARTIIPSLKGGAVVISDRYADSTAAYQGVTLRGIVQNPVQWIREIGSPWNVVPDMTLFFALDPALAIERIKSRESTEKFERLEFLKEVDSNFRMLAMLEPDRFVSIDASRNAEDVSEDALSAIIKLIRGCRSNTR